jgi:cytochrome c-type biogenesis protein CcmH/NrfG
MAKQTMPQGFVKKETMMVIALITFVVGFLGGIFYTALNKPATTGYVQTGQTPGPPQQQSPPAQDFTNQQATQILQLEQEVTVNPTNVQAWTQLGHVYFDTNNFTKAIKAYEKSLELSPNNPNVLTDLGVMYRRNGQSDKALESFNQAMTISPNHEQSRFNKGIVLMYDMGDREGAIKAWEELLRVNPNAVTPDGQPISDAIKSL